MSDAEMESAQIISKEYYNIMGQRIMSPTLGQVIIVFNTYSNGKIEIYKQLY